jgi:flavodoxin I
MIAIVYGSTLDNTKAAAQTIHAELERLVDVKIDLIDVATIKRDLRRLRTYRYLIIGCSTWNIGELQDDWYDAFPQLETLDWTGVTVALFGCGDQHGYPDTFQDALGIIGRAMRERGATLIGRWPMGGYDCFDSLGTEDGFFLGLALDNDNEPKQTPPRITTWVAQLVHEMNLEAAHARS